MSKVKADQFWSQLPVADDPRAAAVQPADLLKLHDYWINVLTAAQVARRDSRMAVNDVKARASRAARLLAIAAELRGYDSSRIMAGHRAILRHLTTDAVPEHGADHDAYRAAVAELARLRLKLWAEVETPSAESHLPGIGYLSVSDLAAAEQLSEVEREALRKRLERWRKRHDKGWMENSDRGPRDPRFLYQPNAVRDELEAVRRMSVDKKSLSRKSDESPCFDVR